MFGLFKNNKPEIIEKIQEAISLENNNLERLKQIIEQAKQNGEHVDVYGLVFHDEMFSPQLNSKKPWVQVLGASSREMFQALNQIGTNTSYNVEHDTVNGKVGDYSITLVRTTLMGKANVGITARLDSDIKTKMLEKYL